jgi:hypothetical protein
MKPPPRQPESKPTTAGVITTVERLKELLSIASRDTTAGFWPDELADGYGRDLVRAAYEKADAWDEDAWAAAAASAINERRAQRLEYLLDNRLVAGQALKTALQMNATLTRQKERREER